MMTTKININEKFSKFSEHWRPKTVAELNGQEFKLAKIKGAKCPQSIWGMDCNAAPKSLAISDGGMVDRATDIKASKSDVQHALSNDGTPHPTLRATFSPWEKGQFDQDVKNNGTAEAEARYDAPMGEWV